MSVSNLEASNASVFIEDADEDDEDGDGEDNTVHSNEKRPSSNNNNQMTLDQLMYQFNEETFDGDDDEPELDELSANGQIDAQMQTGSSHNKNSLESLNNFIHYNNERMISQNGDVSYESNDFGNKRKFVNFV